MRIDVSNIEWQDISSDVVDIEKSPDIVGTQPSDWGPIKLYNLELTRNHVGQYIIEFKCHNYKYLDIIGGGWSSIHAKYGTFYMCIETHESYHDKSLGFKCPISRVQMHIIAENEEESKWVRNSSIHVMSLKWEWLIHIIPSMHLGSCEPYNPADMDQARQEDPVEEGVLQFASFPDLPQWGKDIETKTNHRDELRGDFIDSKDLYEF